MNTQQARLPLVVSGPTAIGITMILTEADPASAQTFLTTVRIAGSLGLALLLGRHLVCHT